MTDDNEDTAIDRLDQELAWLLDPSVSAQDFERHMQRERERRWRQRHPEQAREKWRSHRRRQYARQKQGARIAA